VDAVSPSLVITIGLAGLGWLTLTAPRRTQAGWAVITVLYAAAASMYMGWL